MLNQSTVADGDDYEPLESKPGDDADFNDGLTDGFTIELWLTPMDTDSSSDQVLVALEQRDPASTSISCAGNSDCPDNNCACKDGAKFPAGPNIGQSAGRCFPGFEGTCALLACTNAADGKMGFRLLQSKKNRGGGNKGELTLEYKFSEDGASDCNRLPLHDYDFTVNPPVEKEALGIPTAVSAYGLDLHEGGSLPTPQHVVISVSGALAAPDAGDPPRFAVYVDGALQISSELDNTFKSAFDPAKTFVPKDMWKDFVLRVGWSKMEGSVPWSGAVYMLAMYGKPLTPAEVSANFAAGLDNSAPSASPFDVAVEEDGGTPGCAAIPATNFAAKATDWDNDGLGRGQTLTYRVSDVDNLRGALYSDATCTAAYETGAPIVTALYYKPPADANALGGPFTTVTWEVGDGYSGNNTWEVEGTARATMTINVTAVNDAPVAYDGATSADAVECTAASPCVFMALDTPLELNGTDIDVVLGDEAGQDPAYPVRNAAVRIDAAPEYARSGSTTATASRGSRSRTAASLRRPSCTTRARAPNTSADGEASDRDRLLRLHADRHERVESAAPGKYTITILSGLQARTGKDSVREEGAVDYDADGEEVLSMLTLESQPPSWGHVVPGVGDTEPRADLAVRRAAEDKKGAEILAAGTNVTDVAPTPCQRPTWLCPRLMYEGELDFFSLPKQAYLGTPLNNSDDALNFTVYSDSEVSEPAVQTIEVRNVNDPPSSSRRRMRRSSSW